ncbi:hypothetical protein A2U01_0116400, partial [Trifolium medium]|nr:hypothetical protein [Trifolium medium]
SVEPYSGQQLASFDHHHGHHEPLAIVDHHPMPPPFVVLFKE